MSHDKSPPKWMERFFRWICNPDYVESLEGDLYEQFELDIERFGQFKARWKYRKNVLTLLRPSVIRKFSPLKSTHVMLPLSHQFTRFRRNAANNKSYVFINLLGLIPALALAFLYYSYYSFETSFDQLHSNSQNVYRVYLQHQENDMGYMAIVPPAFSSTLRASYPQVKSTGRILEDMRGTFFQIESNGFLEEDGFFADTDIPRLLDTQMEAGSQQDFDKPNTVLLSHSMFQKFFPGQDFNQQSVKISGKEVKVLGIFEDFPPNTHLRPHYMISMSSALSSVTEERLNSWVWQQFQTYIELEPQANIEDLHSEFTSFIKEKVHPVTKEADFTYLPYFQNIREIHLNSSNFEWDNSIKGSKNALIFTGIAVLLILLIALFNYVNMYSVMTLKKLKEVNVRKSLGATRWSIFFQFWFSSTFDLIIASVLGGLAFIFVFPYFENYLGFNHEISNLLTLKAFGLYALFVLSVSFLSVLY